MASYEPKIESRIGITVPAEVVWEAISDLATWHEWNPLYPRAEGILRLGERLKLTLALPREEPREFTAPLVDWVPNEQILWADTVARGWVKTVRFIEVETLTAQSCIFSNGEQFQGHFAGLYLNKKRRRALREAFGLMSEAVAARAEALWAARVGGG